MACLGLPEAALGWPFRAGMQVGRALVFLLQVRVLHATKGVTCRGLIGRKQAPGSGWACVPGTPMQARISKECIHCMNAALAQIIIWGKCVCIAAPESSVHAAACLWGSLAARGPPFFPSHPLQLDPADRHRRAPPAVPNHWEPAAHKSSRSPTQPALEAIVSWLRTIVAEYELVASLSWRLRTRPAGHLPPGANAVGRRTGLLLL